MRQLPVVRTVRKRYSLRIFAVLLAMFLATAGVIAVFADHIVTGPGGTVVSRATSALLGIGLILGVNLGFVGIVLGGNVALSLRRLSNRAERIGNGNFETTVETDRGDEIGELYDSIEAMRGSLQNKVTDLEETKAEITAERERAEAAKREATEQSEQLLAVAEQFSEAMAAAAAGDLDRRLSVETDDEAIAEIASSYNEMLDQLGGLVAQSQRTAAEIDELSGELEASSSEIQAGSTTVAAEIREIADGASQQSTELTEAADQISQLSATTQEVASATSEMATLSEEVSSLATDGQTAAARTADRMTETVERTETVEDTVETLVAEASEIETVIATIAEIADRINMLALNANIEAARGGGGEANSDGFAVVADEVKALAQEAMDAVGDIERTLESVRHSAEETATEVGDVQDAIQQTATEMRTVEGRLDSIVEGITDVDQSIQGIDTTADEQAERADELSTIVDSVATISRETTESTADLSTTAAEVTTETETVAQLATKLDDETDALSEIMASFTVSEVGTAPSS